ncbi:hypothetical protein GJ496_005557 [Pomphorhynchus laevis]|nr:hypothetical protein GJ496_005350 [Pomphorhynchus laevis]KAI0985008.1 hypothetical protein GJ496_005557 [Pomphorhynchus laevis]
MDRSRFGRSKFKQRNTRKAIGKEYNESFSKTINDDFNEFDPYGPYQRQSSNTAIGYEQGYQTFCKLMDSIMIGTVMEDMNTDAGVAHSLRPEEANFYCDFGYMTPLVAAFNSAKRTELITSIKYAAVESLKDVNAADQKPIIDSINRKVIKPYVTIPPNSHEGSNTKRSFWNVVKQLKQNKEIKICNADKCKKVVVWNTMDYDAEGLRHLESDTYTQITNDEHQAIIKRVSDDLLLLHCYVCRARSDAVGNYRIEFRGTHNPGTSLSGVFSSYYRGQMVENYLVSADLQTTLGLSRRMSQSLVPVITMGSSSMPVLVAIGNHYFQWADVTVEDNVQEAVCRRIMEAVGAQRLVILADHFTVDELVVLRLIANGLPQLQKCSSEMLVLGRGAAPAYPAEVPTALEISTTLAKLAKISYEGASYYAGLIRASANAFRFRGRGDHRAYVDGFVQHRRSTWISPSFRNPLVLWFRLAYTNENAPYDADLASFMGWTPNNIQHRNSHQKALQMATQ